MPLTFSHPAAVVPFARFGLSLSALVIGSMSPDFIYFLRLAPRGHYGHTLPGLLLFCLPAGFTVLWLFHRVIKPPLLSLLPFKMENGGTFRILPLKNLASLSAAILVGAFSHILWDGFTHENGQLAELMPLLKMTVADFGFDRVPLARALHHFGSLIGGAWLLVLIRRWFKEASRRAGQAGKVPAGAGWVAAALVCGSAGFALAYSLTQNHAATGYALAKLVAVQAIVVTGAAFSVSVFLCSILWHALRYARSKGST